MSRKRRRECIPTALLLVSFFVEVIHLHGLNCCCRPHTEPQRLIQSTDGDEIGAGLGVVVVLETDGVPVMVIWIEHVCAPIAERISRSIRVGVRSPGLHDSLMRAT